jgi:hypothetical protein
VGQGQFRRQLIDQWGRCALTGYRDPRFLVASHIKPWRKPTNHERLDPYNGLLLLPNLDKSFDLGYISFEDTGRILISGALEDKEALGVRLTMRLELHKNHRDYDWLTANPPAQRSILLKTTPLPAGPDCQPATRDAWMPAAIRECESAKGCDSSPGGI